MSFCNWRRNKAPFKVGELLRRASRSALQRRKSIKGCAREGERVFAVSPAISKSARCATRGEENSSDSGAEFSRTKSFFVHRPSDGKDSQVKCSRTARSLKDFLKSKFPSHRPRAHKEALFVARYPCLNDYVTRNLLHKMPEKLSPSLYSVIFFFFYLDKISRFFQRIIRFILNFATCAIANAAAAT